MKKELLFTLTIVCLNTVIANTPDWYPSWNDGMNANLKIYQKKYTRNKKIFDELENRYKGYNPENLKKRNTIPHILHSIWVGPHPIPPFFIRCQEAWQKEFPEWNYILWTNEKVEKEMLPLFSDEHRQIYFNGNKDHREKADILRLYLLKHYGGVYVDGDMSCLKPNLFKEMLQYYDFFAGISGHENPEIFNNAVIGSTPNNPIINYLLEKLKNITVASWPCRSGVFFFSKTLLEILPSAPGINMTFPTTIFYAIPFGYSQPVAKYLKPWSLAAHYWANSSNHSWKIIMPSES